jgi:hypothetical protein
MTKIVYNACYGGFSLSHEAVMRYAELKGIKLYTDKRYGFTHYYLCPPEEYESLSAEEATKPVSPDRFERSNGMYFSDRSFERTDPILVQVVEELGEKANGMCAELQIAEIPAGTLYRIDEYDGFESIETKDSYEWSVA